MTGPMARLLLALVLLLVPGPATAARDKVPILVSSPAPNGAEMLEMVDQGYDFPPGGTSFEVMGHARLRMVEQSFFKPLPMFEASGEEPYGTGAWEKDFSLPYPGQTIGEQTMLAFSWRQADGLQWRPKIEVAVRLMGNRRSLHYTNLQEMSDDGDASVSIPLADQDLVPKDSLYLAKRELGLSIDPRWRYSQNETWLVLQRRVDLACSANSLVRIDFAKDEDPEDFRIQFSMDFDGDGRRDAFILLEEIPKWIHRSATGVSYMYMDLLPVLRAKGISPNKAVIMEPLVFCPGTMAEFLKSPSVLGLVFTKATESSSTIAGTVVENNGLMTYLLTLPPSSERIAGLHIAVQGDGLHVYAPSSLTLFRHSTEPMPAACGRVAEELRQWGWSQPVETAAPKAFDVAAFQVLEQKGGEILREHGKAAASPLAGSPFLMLDSPGKSPARVTLDYRRDGRQQRISLLAIPGMHPIEGLRPGDTIERLRAVPLPAAKARTVALALLDVHWSSDGDVSMDSRWWQREALTPMAIRTPGAVPTPSGLLCNVPPSAAGRDAAVFGLPQADPLLWTALRLPDLCSSPLEAVLYVNDEVLPVTPGTEEISLTGYKQPFSRFEVRFSHMGRTPQFAIRPPQMQAFGLRHSLADLMRRMPLSIGASTVPLRLIPRGGAELAVEGGPFTALEGPQPIVPPKSEIFEFTELRLRSASVLSPPAGPGEAGPTAQPASSGGAILRMPVKLLVALAGCWFVFLILRNRSFRAGAESVGRILARVYRWPGHRILALFWFLVCVAAGGAMLLLPPDAQAFLPSMGAVALFALANHLPRARLPFVRPLLADRSAVGFTGLQLRLALCLIPVLALLHALGLYMAAEPLAMAVYLLLAAVTLDIFWQLLRHRSDS